MARMDWSPTNNSDNEPGDYLATVKMAEEKLSRKGDPMLSLRLHTDTFDAPDQFLCFDVVMMGGAGRGLGQAKLLALGFDGTEDEIRAEDVVGRRAWVTVDWQSYTKDGRPQRSLKVVSVFEPEFSCGYRAEDDPPPTASSGIADLSASKSEPAPSFRDDPESSPF